VLKLTKETRVAVYTSIYRSSGLYDILHPPVCVDKHFDYFCFTPHSSIKLDGWHTIKTAWTAGITPRMQAKEYKIFPDRYLKGYNFSIWLDGSFAIRGDLRKLLMKTMEKEEMPFVFFRNYQDNCAYDSAAFCMRNHIGNTNKIKDQLTEYEAKRFPENFGLPMGGMLYRQHNEPSVQIAMELWWDELQRHSERDQLSLPYVLWKLGDKIKYQMIDTPRKRLWNAYFRSYSRKKK
jgi:hypothetical protein